MEFLIRLRINLEEKISELSNQIENNQNNTKINDNINNNKFIKENDDLKIQNQSLQRDLGSYLKVKSTNNTYKENHRYLDHESSDSDGTSEVKKDEYEFGKSSNKFNFTVSKLLAATFAKDSSDLKICKVPSEEQVITNC